MRPVREDVLLERLGQVVKLAQPDGGEVAPVQAEDVAILPHVLVKALQRPVGIQKFACRNTFSPLPHAKIIVVSLGTGVLGE